MTAIGVVGVGDGRMHVGRSRCEDLRVIVGLVLFILLIGI